MRICLWKHAQGGNVNAFRNFQVKMSINNGDLIIFFPLLFSFSDLQLMHFKVCWQTSNVNYIFDNVRALKSQYLWLRIMAKFSFYIWPCIVFPVCIQSFPRQICCYELAVDTEMHFRFGPKYLHFNGVVRNWWRTVVMWCLPTKNKYKIYLELCILPIDMVMYIKKSSWIDR